MCLCYLNRKVTDEDWLEVLQGVVEGDGIVDGGGGGYGAFSISIPISTLACKY